MALTLDSPTANDIDAPASEAAYETTICQLAAYQDGVIVRIEGEASLRNHLLEMGFTRGTHVEFIRRAPLGDPIDVKLRGYRLSLREREACAIVVETTPVAKAPIIGGRGGSIFSRRFSRK